MNNKNISSKYNYKSSLHSRILNYDVETKDQNVSLNTKKRYIPKRADFIATNTKNRNKPCFRCNKCNQLYILEYSRFGKFNCFDESTYYCIDCSESDKFIRM